MGEAEFLGEAGCPRPGFYGTGQWPVRTGHWPVLHNGVGTPWLCELSASFYFPRLFISICAINL